MIHEGERLTKEIERLERELEQPIDSKRRQQIQEAIIHLRNKKSAWNRPRCR